VNGGDRASRNPRVVYSFSLGEHLSGQPHVRVALVPPNDGFVALVVETSSSNHDTGAQGARRRSSGSGNRPARPDGG
jgi:hypothetical protein